MQQTHKTHEQALLQQDHSVVVVADTPRPCNSAEQMTRAAQAAETEEAEEEASYPHLSSEEVEVIFQEAVAEIPTQPLPPLAASPQQRQQRAATRLLLLLPLLLFLVLLGGATLSIVTTPTVTLVLVPRSTHANLTTRLVHLPTRLLVPVLVTGTLSQPTTGHGHQQATYARGTLTFYNGRFAAQTISGGSVLTARDGRQVVVAQSVTIPAASLQQVGVASVAAQARQVGKQGNLPALAINLAVSGDLLAKNLSAFSGGSNARDYPTVAKADLVTVTAQLHQQLTQRLPQAFAVAPGEAVTPTHCTWSTSVDHPLGQEATAVIEQARETCTGVAYDPQVLQQVATAAFTTATRPGKHYILVGRVHTQVMSVLPVVTASIGGWWVYQPSEQEQQHLAEQLAGDSQVQAQASLLATGWISRATVPAGRLPTDPAHLHFAILIGA
ncbi:MAG TPA: baseplate J/gp47 family protein [Ktedonobacteraceae bacterium]|nr:baseplate J/gp47 family protein [Ktedonobacteraceae bacterium]